MKSHGFKVGLVMIALLLVGVVSAQPPSDPSRVFGAVESYYRPGEAAALGVTWDRIVFAWNRFQPNSPEEFDTSSVPDQFLADAAAGNRQIVGVIKSTPHWASASQTPAGVPFGIELAHDDPANLFGAFVRRLVEAYAARGVRHWVIWNEPDIRPGEGIVEFEGEVADYANVLRTAYRAIKAVDPGAHVQLAGLTWWYDVNAYREPYLARLLNTLNRDGNARANNWYFDGISLHIYFTTDSVRDIIAANKRILRAYGLQNKDVWLSEFNASPRRDPAASIGSPFQVSLEQQADFIVQAAALALAQGVDRMAVYRLWDNDFVPGATEPWGLMRADNSPRPAYFAYQQVIRRLTGAGSVRQFSAPGATMVTAAFPDRTVYILWSTGTEAGNFLISAGDVPEVAFADAPGSIQPAGRDGNSAVIPAPGAEMIDMSFVVVAGPVRIVELPGAQRAVSYQSAAGISALR
jgi:polysaccharide biosynthesis protein PslG